MTIFDKLSTLCARAAEGREAAEQAAPQFHAKLVKFLLVTFIKHLGAALQLPSSAQQGASSSGGEQWHLFGQ
eukprot:4323087-Pyramimonas_sp.AAC.1